MKKIKTLLLSFAFLAVMSFTASAQETMMKKAGDAVKTGAEKTVSGVKKGVSKGKRIGHTVGNRTWTGTKWVASSSWRGGRWVAVKTVGGTKWVYRKARGTAKKTL